MRGCGKGGKIKEEKRRRIGLRKAVRVKDWRLAEERSQIKEMVEDKEDQG